MLRVEGGAVGGLLYKLDRLSQSVDVRLNVGDQLLPSRRTDQEIEEVRTHLTVEDPPRVVLLCLDLSRGSVSFSLERVCHPEKRPDRFLPWGGGHLTLHEVLGKLVTQLVVVGIDIHPRSASFRAHAVAAIERAEEIEERGCFSQSWWKRLCCRWCGRGHAEPSTD
jgi:hypothetical protein